MKFAGRFWMLMVPCVAMTLPAAVSYDHDVRPILAANCYACHGPDGSTRKAKLRLDTEQTARPVLKDLLKRISHIDLEERMPPPKSGKKLSAAQIATLRQWIAQGAKWEKHWSLKTTAAPATAQANRRRKKMGSQSHRPFHPRQTTRARTAPLTRGRRAHPHPPPHFRPHRTATNTD